MTYHILPHSHRGWAIVKSGSKRTSAFAPTRRSAEKRANRFLKKLGDVCLIHDGNLKVVGSFSFIII